MSNYKYTDEGKAHLHTLNDKPLLGTSSVVGVLAKPLTWWASGMACGVFGWLNPRFNSLEDIKNKATEVLDQIKSFDVESYLALLKKAYGAHNEKKELSAEAGTDMHSLLEAYVKKCIETNKGVPIFENNLDDNEQVDSFMKWATENVSRFILSEANVYSETMWTGGIFDLLFENKEGKLMLGDFKSSKEAYLSQFIQIAGYDLQLGENGVFDKDGKPVILNHKAKIDGYVVFPFGATKFEPAFRYNTEELREGFKSALVLYKLINQ